MKTKQTIKVNATLQTKNGYYYVVADYKDPETGKRKLKWLSTGELVRTGSKRERSKLTPLVEEKRIEFFLSLQNTCDTPFLSYAQQWAENNEYRYAKSTFSRYSRIIDTNITYFFDPLNLKIGEVSKNHIEQFYQHLFAEGKTPKTVETIRNVLRNIFTSAIDDELIFDNPFKKAKCIVPNATKEKSLNNFDYLRQYEINTIFEMTQKHAYLFPMIHILITYGLRPGELLGLRWKSVDLDNGTMDINFNAVQIQNKMDYKPTLKTQHTHRSFALAPETIEILKKVKTEQAENKKLYKSAYIDCGYDFVFTHSNGEPFKEKNVNLAFQRLLKRNGFRKMKLYDLRHTCCSTMVNAKNKDGVAIFTIKEIMEYMGHKDIETTIQVYAHVEEKNKKDISSKILSVIPSQLGTC